MKYQVDKLTLEEYKELLPKVHQNILAIAKEIKRLCDKHSIKYFLIGGTLLGAVRHSGFIPWDDDMDIGFLRDDYNTFLKVCKTDLDDKFELITTDIPNYGLPFAKIQMKGTTFLEQNATHYPCGNGIYVDCFPIDKIPNDEQKRKFHNLQAILLKYCVMKKSGYTKLRGIRIHNKILATVYCALFSRKSLINQLNSCCSKYNHKANSNYYMNSGSAYNYGREVFPCKSLEADLPTIEFEGVSFKCPNSPEQILSLLYGDYMKLPPEDKRYNRHGILEIEVCE